MEIGAASGNVLMQFKEVAKNDFVCIDMYGNEYNPDLVAAAERKGIHMYCGGCKELITSTETFDVIIMSHVLEHITDLSAALKIVRELMKEETLLYIEVPGVKALHWDKWQYYRRDFLNYFTLAHVWHFSLRTLVSVLELHGFQLVEGCELVQAIFKKTDIREPFDPPYSRDEPDEVEAYLTNMYTRGQRECRNRRLKKNICKLLTKLPSSLRIKS